jgi:hypothetical protein
MIHNPWGMAVGDAREMIATAEILNKMTDSLARTYASRSKTGIRSIKEMMDKETWLTAKEAVEAGFADKIMAKTEAKARFDMSIFSNTPSALHHEAEALEAVETETDIEKLLMRDAGPRTRSQARALMNQIHARKTRHTEAMPRAGGVRLDGLAAALKAARETITTQR